MPHSSPYLTPSREPRMGASTVALKRSKGRITAIPAPSATGRSMPSALAVVARQSKGTSQTHAWNLFRAPPTRAIGDASVCFGDLSQSGVMVWYSSWSNGDWRGLGPWRLGSFLKMWIPMTRVEVASDLHGGSPRNESEIDPACRRERPQPPPRRSNPRPPVPAPNRPHAAPRSHAR